MSVSFSHSMAYSLHPYTLAARTLCHPIGRQSQFRHAHSVDALLSSLHSLLLVIITKHVLIIVSLFGMHLCLYILALGGARILTLCLHPKSSVRPKALLTPHYLLYLLTLWLFTSPLPFATGFISDFKGQMCSTSPRVLFLVTQSSRFLNTISLDPFIHWMTIAGGYLHEM